MIAMPSTIRDNPARSRFELDAGGVTAFLNYRLAGNVMTLDHTETPIAARLSLTGPGCAITQAEFDFRQTGLQTWDIDVATDAGHLSLSKGGSVMSVDARPVDIPAATEYSALYAHFADLIRRRTSDVDVAPLRLVADAFLCGRRVEVEPFVE